MVYFASISHQENKFYKDEYRANVSIFVSYLLPVFIPQSFLKTFNQMISSFIWNNKPAHIRKEFMERPKGVGGLLLTTANLNTTSLWLKDWNDRIPAWLQIEKATSIPHSLPALLCAHLPTLVNNIKDSIIVTQSLRIVNQFKRCVGIQSILFTHQ